MFDHELGTDGREDHPGDEDDVEVHVRVASELTPGGFENLIEAASVPAETRAVPPPSVLPPANIAEIIRRHGNELLAG